MKVFTVTDGNLVEGAIVEKSELNSGAVIPAIILGGSNNLRRAILSVHLNPDEFRVWKKNGAVKISEAVIGKSNSGRLKLVSAPHDDMEKVLVVARTNILGGSNKVMSHLSPEDKIIESTIRTNNWLSDEGGMQVHHQFVYMLKKDNLLVVRHRKKGVTFEMKYTWNGEKLIILQ